MAYITKYGSTWGTLPATTGRVYFVAPGDSYVLGDTGISYSASNDNDGLSPERALRRPQRAHTLAAADQGDVIFLLPGRHVLDETLSITKAGVKVLGAASAKGEVNLEQPQTVIAGMSASAAAGTGLADDLVNIAADEVELAYVKLVPTMGYDAVCFESGAELNGIWIHDFKIDMYTASVSLQGRGIDMMHRQVRAGSGYEGLGNGASALRDYVIERFVIESDGAWGPGIEIATGQGIIRNGYVRNTAGTWAAPIRVGTDVDGVVCHNLTFIAQGTMTVAFEGTDHNVDQGLFVHDCRFPVGMTDNSKPFDGFTAAEETGDLIFSECFVMSATGNGGVTRIT